MNKIITCKRCGETDLIQISKETPTLNYKGYMEIEGIQCNRCGCFHFDIENFSVHEFYAKEQVYDTGKVVGKYMTDYDRKLLEK